MGALFAYDNLADDASYSLGSWFAALPLNNLKVARPRKIARSSNALAASTKFLVDFGYDAPVQIFALVRDNLTAAATVRLRFGPNADGSAALLDVTLTAGDFGSYQSAVGRVIYYVADELDYAQYVLVEITDTANPAGYVDLGRFIAGPVFQPGVNMRVGAQFGPIDETRLSRAVDHTQYADRRPLRWRAQGEFELLEQSEALGQVYELQRLRGITEPLLAVLEAELTGDRGGRTTIYGVMVTLEPIVDAIPGNPSDDGGSDLFSWRFAIEETP